MGDERFERGWSKFRELNEPYAEQMRETMERDEPELFRFIVEFVFGEVLSRPVLDLKTRELVTVAVLTALGNARQQLRLHIHAALNVGWSREEVHEIIMQQAVYAGFPAALNGATLAREVFAHRDKQNLS
ncbi:MAG: carboxymuconolactone decarboxylase family protein [Actinobacteria bacterium]|nr:carboxymuconolactone decarboxylase family protein [Actinomycetota bacterium]